MPLGGPTTDPHKVFGGFWKTRVKFHRGEKGHLDEVQCNQRLEHGAFSSANNTVDGRNPAPPGMVKTL